MGSNLAQLTNLHMIDLGRQIPDGEVSAKQLLPNIRASRFFRASHLGADRESIVLKTDTGFSQAFTVPEVRALVAQ